MSREHIEALELARDGDWDRAHALVQEHGDTLSCLIHAYLHREEGDMGNARFWYSRAGEAMPANSLEEEWERLREMA